MANTTKSQHEDPEVVIQSAIGRTEDFIERNSKMLSGVLIAIVVIAAGYFGYKYLYALPQEGKAADAMFVAEQLFQQGDYAAALEGDGNNAGFLEVADSFGSTPQGNLARHYAGICYIKEGKQDEALEILAKYRASTGAPNAIINAQNFGLRGDILVQKEQYKEALGMFRKAIDASSNVMTTPYFLKKAGVVSEKLGQNAEALAFYQRISDEYGASMEARDIERSIGRVKQL